MNTFDKIGSVALDLIKNVNMHINAVNDFESTIPQKICEAKARRAKAFAAFAAKVEEMKPTMEAFVVSRRIEKQDRTLFLKNLEMLVLIVGELCREINNVKALTLSHESVFNQVERGPAIICGSLSNVRKVIDEIKK